MLNLGWPLACLHLFARSYVLFQCPPIRSRKSDPKLSGLHDIPHIRSESQHIDVRLIWGNKCIKPTGRDNLKTKQREQGGGLRPATATEQEINKIFPPCHICQRGPDTYIGCVRLQSRRIATDLRSSSSSIPREKRRTLSSRTGVT